MVQEKLLLLVDDETNILRSLSRLLRRDSYTILTASSGREGLEILQQQPVQVIVSDQRMPEMSGVEFLSKARELYPDTIRIALSGYTDLNSVTEAVNKGAIYKFLTKPWEDDELRQHISEAFNLYHKNSAHRPSNANVIIGEAAASTLSCRQSQPLTLSMLEMLIDALPQAILVFDREQNVLCGNQKARQWFCASPATAPTLPPSLGDIPAEVLSWVRQINAQVGHVRRKLSTPQGTQWDVDITQLAAWPGGPAVMVSLLPVTSTMEDADHV